MGLTAAQALTYRLLMRRKLSAKLVESLQPISTKRFEVWDSLLPGFGIRIAKGGRRTWFATSRSGGRLIRHTIGTYPAVSLQEAREVARTVIRDMQTGAYAAQQANLPSDHLTFGQAIPLFIEKYARPKNRGWKATQAVLKKFGALNEHDLRKIARADVVRVLDDIAGQGTPIAANRALSAIKKLFAWALDRGMVDVHPIAGLKKPGKEMARDRVLTDHEIGRFWTATEAIGFPFGPLHQLLLVTGQRRGEVARMQWPQIDFERKSWIIPAQVAKNGRAHEVPLSDMALTILAALPSFSGADLVFTTNGRTPVSGFGRAKDQLDRGMQTADWRVHDLRRTAASGMARLEVQPHVIEKVLNHVTGTVSGVAAVYNRHGYEREKRLALDAWAEWLCKDIVGPSKSTSKVPGEGDNEFSRNRRMDRAA